MNKSTPYFRPRLTGARLDEFRSLKDGWLDGLGFAPEHSSLDWLGKVFVQHYPDEPSLPYLYPTAEGGVQAEWTLAGHEISLEIDLAAKNGEWHDLDMQNQKEDTQQLKLDQAADWHWIVEQISRLEKEALAGSGNGR